MLTAVRTDGLGGGPGGAPITLRMSPSPAPVRVPRGGTQGAESVRGCGDPHFGASTKPSVVSRVGRCGASSSAINLTNLGRDGQGQRQPRQSEANPCGSSELRCDAGRFPRGFVLWPLPFTRPGRSRDRGNDPADPAAQEGDESWSAWGWLKRFINTPTTSTTPAAGLCCLRQHRHGLRCRWRRKGRGGKRNEDCRQERQGLAHLVLDKNRRCPVLPHDLGGDNGLRPTLGVVIRRAKARAAASASVIL